MSWHSQYVICHINRALWRYKYQPYNPPTRNVDISLHESWSKSNLSSCSGSWVRKLWQMDLLCRLSCLLSNFYPLFASCTSSHQNSLCITHANSFMLRGRSHDSLCFLFLRGISKCHLVFCLGFRWWNKRITNMTQGFQGWDAAVGPVIQERGSAGSPIKRLHLVLHLLVFLCLLALCWRAHARKVQINYKL